MYPESYYDDKRQQQKPRNPLTLDIYPSEYRKTKFELIEDDGLTYKFKTESMYNKTLIECDPTSQPDAVVIKISGQYEGRGYTDMPKKRNYHLKIHGRKPHTVFIKRAILAEMKNTTALEQAADGWYFNPDKNVTQIKVKTQNSKSTFFVTISRAAF